MIDIEEIISEVSRRLAEDKWQDKDEVILDVIADKIKVCELDELDKSDVYEISDEFGIEWDWDMENIENRLAMRLSDRWHMKECRDGDDERVYALEFERYIKK